MSSTRSIKVSEFYRVTWQLLLLVTCGVAMLARVARPLVLLPSFLLAVLIMSSIGSRWQRYKQRIAVAIGFTLLLVASEQVLHIARREDLVSIMIEMICGALPWLLLSHEKARSYWLAILNVIVIGVGSMTLAANSFVYLGFLLLIILVLLNLNAANLFLASSTLEVTREDLPRGYFRQFLYVMPIGLISALAIFFLFPRVQSFTMSLGKNMGGITTGYSGGVDLSGGGELQPSQALAFMVDSEDKAWLKQGAAQLLFRGDSLGSFDGVHWSNNIFDFRPSESLADLRVATEHERNPRRATIHLEPASTAAVFYPDVLLHVSTPAAGAAHFLTNANGSVIRDPFQYERFTYDITIADALKVDELPQLTLSEIHQQLAERERPLPHELGHADLTTYLAVPNSVLQAPYFKAWLKEVDLDPQVATLAAAEKRLTRLFTSRFNATLDNRFAGTNALATFLGQSRQGHCEYFATTAALTLRALGVPTRVVVGYNGGTFNDLVDVLEVRDEDAHAWIEAYVPDLGWHAYNPTPASNFLTATLASRLRLFIDGAGFWLRRYVIDYDQSTQHELLMSLRELGKMNGGSPTDMQPLLKNFGRVAAALVALVVFYVATRRFLYRASPLDLPGYYQLFLRKMQRLDLGRSHGETITAYHARLAASAGLGTVLFELEQAVTRDLYSPTPLNSEERAALLRRVRALRPALPKAPS